MCQRFFFIRGNHWIRFSPERWGHWLQSEPTSWFHWALSGQDCEGCQRFRPVLHQVCRTLREHFCEVQTTALIHLFCERGGINVTSLTMVNTPLLPKAKGGVGEIGRAVKVPNSKTASDVSHCRQSPVALPDHPSLYETFTGSITKGHETIVVIETGNKLDARKEFKCFTNMYHEHSLIGYTFLIQLLTIVSLQSVFSSDLLHTTPHLENLDWLLMRKGLSGFLPPSRVSVHTSHSLCPVAKFQYGIAKFSLPVSLCRRKGNTRVSMKKYC